MRPPFPYFGAKVGIASRIVDIIPPHRVYLEAYAGSAAVLLAKPPSTHEILNDTNGAIVTFFRVLRDTPEDLERALWLTPYARDEYLADRLDEPGLSDIETARRLFVRSSQSVMGIVEGRTTWSASASQGANRARTVETHLRELQEVARRLHGCTIDNRDAVDAIRLYASTPDAVVYADPPYLAETRAGAGGYEHDQPGEGHHRRLLAALIETPAFVILSGYPSPLYDEILTGWTKIEIDRIHRGGVGAKTARTEVLYLNRSPDAGRLFG